MLTMDYFQLSALIHLINKYISITTDLMYIFEHCAGIRSNLSASWGGTAAHLSLLSPHTTRILSLNSIRAVLYNVLFFPHTPN